MSTNKVSIALTQFLLVCGSMTVTEGALTTDRIDKIDKTLNQIVADNAYNHQGVYCMPGRPYIDGERFIGEIDLLYWHPRVNDTSFGYKSERPVGVSPIRGPLYDLNWAWDFGIRLGGGYNLPFDGFNLNLSYLYFQSSKSTNVYGTTISPFIPTKSIYLLNQSVVQAKSSGDLSINSIDLTLSRESFLSPYFIVSPYAGLKNSWLRFKQNTSYSGGNFLDVNSVYVNDKSNFWGIGPKVGTGMKWFIGNGFDVKGDLAFSFEYGTFKSTYDDRMSQIPTNQIRLVSQSHQFAPIAEFAIGLGWGSYVNQCQQFVELMLSYEGEYWFNQNQTLVIQDANATRVSTSYSDLSVHGATLSFRVNF